MILRALIKLSMVRAMAIGLGLVLMSSLANAHKNVVVIPMFDGSEELKPSSPITNIGLSNDNYIIDSSVAIDKVTQLQWQRTGGITLRDYNSSWNYCANLILNSHNDWRMPTINELVSIVDYARTAVPILNVDAFRGGRLASYWSATDTARASDVVWGVLFSDGFVLQLSKTESNYVRCVR